MLGSRGCSEAAAGQTPPALQQPVPLLPIKDPGAVGPGCPLALCTPRVPRGRAEPRSPHVQEEARPVLGQPQQLHSALRHLRLDLHHPGAEAKAERGRQAATPRRHPRTAPDLNGPRPTARPEHPWAPHQDLTLSPPLPHMPGPDPQSLPARSRINPPIPAGSPPCPAHGEPPPIPTAAPGPSYFWVYFRASASS